MEREWAGPETERRRTGAAGQVTTARWREREREGGRERERGREGGPL